MWSIASLFTLSNAFEKSADTTDVCLLAILIFSMILLKTNICGTADLPVRKSYVLLLRISSKCLDIRLSSKELYTFDAMYVTVIPL